MEVGHREAMGEIYDSALVFSKGKRAQKFRDHKEKKSFSCEAEIITRKFIKDLDIKRFLYEHLEPYITSGLAKWYGLTCM